MLVPCSHRTTGEAQEIVHATFAPGDTLWMPPCLLHGGTVNATGMPRRMLLIVLSDKGTLRERNDGDHVGHAYEALTPEDREVVHGADHW